jgi:hypothetical protein
VFLLLWRKGFLYIARFRTLAHLLLVFIDHEDPCTCFFYWLIIDGSPRIWVDWGLWNVLLSVNKSWTRRLKWLYLVLCQWAFSNKTYLTILWRVAANTIAVIWLDVDYHILKCFRHGFFDYFSVLPTVCAQITRSFVFFFIDSLAVDLFLIDYWAYQRVVFVCVIRTRVDLDAYLFCDRNILLLDSVENISSLVLSD